MRLRKVRFPSDSRTEWRIKGWTNDGTSSQDDDGYRNINEALKIETVEEAIRLFEAKIEELKQSTWGDGNRAYERISIALETKRGSVTKTIKKVSLAFEKCVREEVVTFKAGRGWIESKKWLNLEGSVKLKSGNVKRKYVRSES